MRLQPTNETRDRPSALPRGSQDSPRRACVPQVARVGAKPWRSTVSKHASSRMDCRFETVPTSTQGRFALESSDGLGVRVADLTKTPTFVDLRDLYPRFFGLPLLCGIASIGLACVVGSSPAPVDNGKKLATSTAEPVTQVQIQSGEASETPPEPEPEKIVYTPDARDVTAPAFTLDDPSGVALDNFYAALARTDRGQDHTITRVAHFGDSSIGQDGLPHELRKRFQDRFGDAGAGFVLLQRYSTNYLNRVVRAQSDGVWQVCYIAYGCRPDGRYGYGGHIFTGGRGEVTTFATTARDQLGGQVKSFELWYQAWPRGGRVALAVDGEKQEVLETRSPTIEDRWHRIEVPLGSHRLRIKPQGGQFRGYGVVLEAEGPGVVWDTMSMIGAFTKRLLFFADAHISGQVAHRNPDLIVLNYGGNDLRRFVNRSVFPDRFREEFRSAIARMRAGKPSASCLVVGVIDHGRSGTYAVEPKHVELVTRVQREAAIAEGCAFFDSYRAMGGPKSIYKWRKQGLASPDLKHLNPRGREKMGGYMYDALIAGYVDYRRREAAGTIH